MGEPQHEQEHEHEHDELEDDEAAAVPAKPVSHDEPAAPVRTRRQVVLSRLEQFSALIVSVVLCGMAVQHLMDLPLGPVNVDRNAVAAPPPYHLIVDVNTASWRRIALVPGIGEKRAKQIVEERETNGPFNTLDDLATRIRGIGPATVEKLRDFMVAQPVLPTGSVNVANGTQTQTAPR